MSETEREHIVAQVCIFNCLIFVGMYQGENVASSLYAGWNANKDVIAVLALSRCPMLLMTVVC